MKKYYLSLFILVAGWPLMFSQVGINTSTPASTMDIVAKNATGTTTSVDGILVPRVDRQRAQSMTSIPISTLIYINSIATGSATGFAQNITSTGYYYFDGTFWVKLINAGTDVNIYTSDGTLSANREVTMGTSGTNSLSFSGGTSGLSRIIFAPAATDSNITLSAANRSNMRWGAGSGATASNLDVFQDVSSTAQIVVNGASTGLLAGSALGSTAPVKLIANGTPALTAINGGNVGIGTETPATTLHVQGTARVTGSTGTPITVTGRDVNGNIGDVTVGTGLSLTSGTLAATAVPISNVVFPFVNVQPNTTGTSYVLDSQVAPNYTIWVSVARPSTLCSVDLPDPNTMVGRTVNIIAAGTDTRVCVPSGQGLPAANSDNDPFKIIPSTKRMTFQASGNFGGMWAVISKDF